MTDPLPTHRQPLPLADRDSNTPQVGCLRVTILACLIWALLIGAMLLEALP
jgi:hypothetical protein